MRACPGLGVVSDSSRSARGPLVATTQGALSPKGRIREDDAGRWWRLRQPSLQSLVRTGPAEGLAGEDCSGPAKLDLRSRCGDEQVRRRGTRSSVAGRRCAEHSTCWSGGRRLVAVTARSGLGWRLRFGAGGVGEGVNGASPGERRAPARASRLRFVSLEAVRSSRKTMPWGGGLRDGRRGPVGVMQHRDEGMAGRYASGAGEGKSVAGCGSAGRTVLPTISARSRR